MEYSYLIPPDFRLKYSNDFVDYIEKFFFSFSNVYRYETHCLVLCNVCHVT